MAEACFSMRVVKAEITKNRRRQLAEIFVNFPRRPKVDHVACAKSGLPCGNPLLLSIFSQKPKSHFWLLPNAPRGRRTGKGEGAAFIDGVPIKCRPEEKPRGQRLRVPAGLSFTHGKKF